MPTGTKAPSRASAPLFTLRGRRQNLSPGRGLMLLVFSIPMPSMLSRSQGMAVSTMYMVQSTV